MPHTYMRTVSGGSNGTTARRAVSYSRIATPVNLAGPGCAEIRHVDDAAGEVGVDLRHEERHRGYDRLGRLPTRPVEVLPELLRRVLGLHCTRPQCVDRDPEWTELGRDRAAVALERSLGHDIDEVAGRHERLRRVLRAARRNVDDASAARALHDGRDRACEQVEAAHVH